MDFTYPKVKEPNYYDKLDDFNHGLDKLPEEDEPEEEDEEEYDPYSQPKYDRPAYDEYYRSNPTYNNEDVYMYPPFRNEPPYGNTRFYPETNFVGENSGYEAPPPALSQEPPKELYPNPDRYEMPVQEDYPPPQLSYKEFREEEPPQEEVYNEVVEDEKKKEVDTSKEAFPEHLAARIQCAKTGFYQNPDDCRTFVACVLDPYYRKPYMHLMRCPAGLVWDNEIQICMEYSSTCNVGGFYSQKHSKLAVPTGYEDPEPVQYDPPPQEPYHEEEAPVADNNQDDNEAYQQPTQQDPIEYQDIGPSYFPPQHRGGYYDAEEEPQEKFYEPVDYQPKK